VFKAPPVAAELELQRERGQRVDFAEAAQLRDGRPALLVAGKLSEPQRERRLA
jgi:hypothetical protein